MSAQVEDFDSSKYYLGTLCKRNHDWNGTGMSLRYNKDKSKCGECVRLRVNTYYKNKVGREIRPNVGRYDFSNGVVATIQGGRGRLIIPLGVWSTNCNFIRLVLDKKSKVIEFRTHLKKLYGYRRAHKQRKQVYISIPAELVNAINGGAGKLYIENGSLKFYLEDYALMPWFEAWVRSWTGNGIRNPMDLRVQQNFTLSINPAIWPKNGQYAFPKWSGKSLFLTPSVTQFKGNIKVYRNGDRLRITARKFFKLFPENFPRDWQLKETLPDGTLRFSPWGKGRKVTPKAINPVIDYAEETPKQLPDDYTPFDEWELE